MYFVNYLGRQKGSFVNECLLQIVFIITRTLLFGFFIRFEFDLKCKVERSSCDVRTWALQIVEKNKNKQFSKEYSMLPYWPESQGPLTFRYNRFCKKKLS